MLLLVRHIHEGEGTHLQYIDLPDHEPQQGDDPIYETVDGTLHLSWTPMPPSCVRIWHEGEWHLHVQLQGEVPSWMVVGTVWPDLPLPKRSAALAVSNLCGTCKLIQGTVQASAFSCMFRGATRWRRELYTLAGTLYLKRNQREMDFKGVRSLPTLLSVMQTTLGVPIALEVHMLVLTGSIGTHVHLGQPCFLVTRASSWCTPHVKHNDVCNCVTLEHIRWDDMHCLPSERRVALQRLMQDVTSRIHVSRKGKLVMHLHWDKGHSEHQTNDHAWLQYVVREVGECTLAVLRHTLLVS